MAAVLIIFTAVDPGSAVTSAILFCTTRFWLRLTRAADAAEYISRSEGSVSAGFLDVGLGGGVSGCFVSSPPGVVTASCEAEGSDPGVSTDGAVSGNCLAGLGGIGGGTSAGEATGAGAEDVETG